jgi:hypothetical protein
VQLFLGDKDSVVTHVCSPEGASEVCREGCHGRRAASFEGHAWRGHLRMTTIEHTISCDRRSYFVAGK